MNIGESRSFVQQIDHLYAASGLCPITSASCCARLPDPALCAAYVGPSYGEYGKPKILFVGLDHGDAGGGTSSAKERQSSILGWYRDENGHKSPWNQHYRPLNYDSSTILQSGCVLDCDCGCRRDKSSADCTLCNFSQTNMVKCVSQSRQNRNFLGERFIQSCVGTLLGEIRILKPEVMVIHGGQRRRQLLCDALSPTVQADPAKGVQIIESAWGGSDRWILILAFLHHPSHGWLSKDRKRGIRQEILGEIKKLLPQARV